MEVKVKSLKAAGIAIYFLHPTTVWVDRESTGWTVSIDSFNISAQEKTLRGAVGSLIQRVSTTCRDYIRAFTCGLDSYDRAMKGTMLGTVDIVKSGLDGPRPTTYYVFGTPVEKDGAFWLVCGDAWYEIPDEMADKVSDRPRSAKVATDEYGVPVGPVVEMDYGLTDEEGDAVIDRWNARFFNGL